MQGLRSEHLHTLYAMWRHPRMSRPDLIAFQNRKLRALVAHAYANVPHYRELFAGAGIKPTDIRTVADLPLLPPTTKDDLRRRPLRETLATGVDPRHLVAWMTSGSSGQPFTIRRSSREDHLIRLFRVRARRQVGVRTSDRLAHIREMPLGGSHRTLADRLRMALGVHRDYDVDGLRSAEDITRELERLQPHVITGYPSVLAYVAEARPARIKPRLVITGGELLTPGAREVIERGFGAPLFDFYGAHEFNLLAWECPLGGLYHACDDNLILEILSDGRPVGEGEAGEVVATNLHAYAMPFIRYRTGDIAIRGADRCRCGQPFSTLRSIQGRAVEYFRLPGDRWVHPFEITGSLIEHAGAWVLQHQLIQESREVVTLKIAPRRPPSPDELDRLRRLGHEKLGSSVEFTIDLVAGFSVQPGKKFSPYLSRLEPSASFPRLAAGPGERQRRHHAEFAVTPDAVLVHDPVAVGAFATMEGIDDPALLLRELLFRDRPDPGLYARQHRAFVDLLRMHVRQVIYLSEIVGDHESFRAARTNPNQVFTRDSLITLPWVPDGYIAARMAKPIRRSETTVLEIAMKRLGLREIVRLPENLFLEGGDVVPFSCRGRRTLLVGYGQRTRLDTLHYLRTHLIPQFADEIVGVELAEWRINLDGGFLPVAEDVVVADVKSVVGGIRLDEGTQQELDIFGMLDDLGVSVIEVTHDESVFCQACNCLCLGERKVIYYDLSERVYHALQRHGIEVHRTPGSELVKGRGGPRCMTRPIYKMPISATPALATT